METKINNLQGMQNSLQVSIVKDIPKGDCEPGVIFLIKNNTEEDIQVTVIPAGQDDEIITTLYQGWNPELIKKVIGAPSGLQYGY